ncbi:conserved hypothetical protein [Ricinus communis]|uniref:Uncharacterized protein n=1 Tax=Ricinus communis TaxID=3988 RepID=B9T2H5_RICCO|nr:conserved hypothetical protein [Ricinus communis]
MSTSSNQTRNSLLLGTFATCTSSTPIMMYAGNNMHVDLLTSMVDDNPTRRLSRYHIRKYFECLDLELPPFQKGYFVKLKAEKEKLQEQLKMKVELEKLLGEKVILKHIELERKNEYCIQAIRTMNELSLKTYEMEKGMRNYS